MQESTDTIKTWYEETKREIDEYNELENKLTEKLGYDKHHEKSLREKTAAKIIGVVQNVKIRYEDFKDCATFEEILLIANENYLNKADEIARKEIERAASGMLPHIDYDQRKNGGWKLEDVIDGNKLKLRIYTQKDIGSNKTRLGNYAIEELQALIKLTKILNNGIPSQTTDGVISEIYGCNPYMATDENGTFERKDVKGICGISWIQVYKNGKVIVAFKFPSEAQKVAQRLIEVGNEKLKQW